ncbi:MAG: hypothetical protein IT495_15680 [Gammaproteobacteria bacterium]|nr:hypothetical protein [Gammaproteobacteria bacterium]
MRTTAALALLAGLVAGCTGESNPYYPLERGRWWLYRAGAQNTATRWEHRYFVLALRRHEIGGERLWVRHEHDGTMQLLRSDRHGTWLVASATTGTAPRPRAPAELVAPNGRDAAAQWRRADRTRVLRTRAANDKFTDYTVQLAVNVDYHVGAHDDAVTTAAGRFEHCLRVDGTGRGQFDLGLDVGFVHVEVNVHEWYAPRIGMVRRERRESTDSPFINDGSYVLELEAWGD